MHELLKYLEKRNPPFTLLYFHAKWNPMVEEIEEEYRQTCQKYSQFEHIKVDSDKTPTAKLHFGQKAIYPNILFSMYLVS